MDTVTVKHTTPPVCKDSLAEELRALRALTAELATRMGPQQPLQLSLFGQNSINPALAAGPLAEALWRLCGRRKCMVLRTRLNQMAEAEDGRRTASRDQV